MTDPWVGRAQINCAACPICSSEEMDLVDIDQAFSDIQWHYWRCLRCEATWYLTVRVTDLTLTSEPPGTEINA